MIIIFNVLNFDTVEFVPRSIKYIIEAYNILTFYSVVIFMCYNHIKWNIYIINNKYNK